MEIHLRFAAFFIAIMFQHTSAHNEIMDIIFEAQDLTSEQINILHPVFAELQFQYDYILTTSHENNNENMTRDLYESTQHEFEEYFASFFLDNEPTTVYDINLPTVEELMGNVRSVNELAQQNEIDEFLDIQQLLQETLDDAQLELNKIVMRALRMKSELKDIGKYKKLLVKYIAKGLLKVFAVSVRVSRSAYCIYSHIPQFNTSLHNMRDGIDCYKYTKTLVQRIEDETVYAVKTITKTLYSMADIYKRIANKHSLVGKIATLVLNLNKILTDIRETYAVSTKAMDDLENQVPKAVEKTARCSSQFTSNVPQMTETLRNVTTCITFKEEPTQEYDFLKAETVKIE